MNDCVTTTKQSTTKPCAYFLGYTVSKGCYTVGATPKLKLKLNDTMLHTGITSMSTVKSFSYFAQSTNVSLSCRIKHFKLNGQLGNSKRDVPRFEFEIGFGQRFPGDGIPLFITLIARFTGPTWGLLIWGRQDPGGLHLSHINLAIWV